MVLVLAVAGAGAWEVHQHGRADAAVHTTLRDARHLLDEGWDNHDFAKLGQARLQGKCATNLARSPWASAALRDKAVAFESEALERLQRAERNERLRAELLDIADPHDGGRYLNDEGGPGAAAALPGEDERHAAAFRRWGAFDIDRTPENDLLSRLQREPKAVVRQATAGLDNWIRALREKNQPDEKWRKLYRIAQQLDPSERGRSLRQIMVGEAPRRVENVVGLVGGLGAWPAVWELGRAPGLRGLLDFTETTQPAAEHALTLAQLAPCVNPSAIVPVRRPCCVAAWRPGPPTRCCCSPWVGCWSTSCGWMKRSSITGRPAPLILPWVCGWPRPWVGQGTGGNKKKSFRTWRASNPAILTRTSIWELRKARRGLWHEAEVSYRKAIELDPEHLHAIVRLGTVLDELKRPSEALAAYRKAIEPSRTPPTPTTTSASSCGIWEGTTKPWQPTAGPSNSSRWMPRPQRPGPPPRDLGKLDQALAGYREAIKLKPNYAMAYNNLGNVLSDLRRPDDAVAAYQKAIELRPDKADVHSNLGDALDELKRPAEAEAAYRKAIESGRITRCTTPTSAMSCAI